MPVALAFVRHAKYASCDGQNYGHALAEEHIEDEQDEVLLVVCPDTIVDPWAMVVHAENTAITNAAVMDILSLELEVFAMATHFVSLCTLLSRENGVNPAILVHFLSRQLIQRSDTRISCHAFNVGPTNGHE